MINTLSELKETALSNSRAINYYQSSFLFYQNFNSNGLYIIETVMEELSQCKLISRVIRLVLPLRNCSFKFKFSDSSWTILSTKSFRSFLVESSYDVKIDFVFLQLTWKFCVWISSMFLLCIQKVFEVSWLNLCMMLKLISSFFN